MTDHDNARAVYERPRIEEYGTLRDITAQLEQALPAGIGVAGASSVPTGGPPPGGPERTPPGPVPEGNPGGGLAGEEESGGGRGPGGGGGGGSGVGGAELGGGGGGGGGGDTVSTGAAELPFTGFPAAVAAVAGAGMASAGAALRRILKRR